MVMVLALLACRGLRDTLWDIPVISVLFIMGLWLMFAGAGVIECAQFRTRNGDGEFRIPAENDRERFESFIHALTNQIQVATKAA
jgi:hypothetical protein